MPKAPQVSGTKPISKQNPLSRKEEQGMQGWVCWTGCPSKIPSNQICSITLKLNPNPSLMMSRPWTCLPGTCLPQGWGLTSCHLQLINSFKHPHAHSCSCNRECCLLLLRNSCLQQGWLKYFGEPVWWKGYKNHTWIHYFNRLHYFNCSMKDPTAFAIPLAASMQECRTTWRRCPFLQLASLVTANILEGCKIIRSVDQACKRYMNAACKTLK